MAGQTSPGSRGVPGAGSGGAVVGAERGRGGERSPERAGRAGPSAAERSRGRAAREGAQRPLAGLAVPPVRCRFSLLHRRARPNFALRRLPVGIRGCSGSPRRETAKGPSPPSRMQGGFCEI